MPFTAADKSPQAQDTAFLTGQLITCIGNKRALLAPIAQAIAKVKRRLGRERLAAADLFAGSGVVSRLLKQHADRLISNDIETYAATVGRCYLRNADTIDWPLLRACIDQFNQRVDTEPMPAGFIEELYAPADEANIQPGERVFYTPANARRIDRYRQMIGELPADLRDLLLGPLLSRASVHANTAGVFKGFYKDRRTGIGCFGGSNADALSRITGRIELDPPVLSRFDCDCEIHQRDANELATDLRDLDLTYIDPPYNQHPYGSNYFMLNLIVHYQRPTAVSRVSGIPADWQRSGYNVRAESAALLEQLLGDLDSRFILVSFNDDGFIAPDAMRAMLEKLGRVDVIHVPYNTFRGGRNLRGRAIHVTEQLFLVERR